jgi:hypothetical protein
MSSKSDRVAPAQAGRTAGPSETVAVAFTGMDVKNAVALFEFAARAAAQTPGNNVQQIAEIAAVAAGLTAKLHAALQPES